MGSQIKINDDQLKKQLNSELGLKKCTIEVGFFDDVMHPINKSTKEFLNAKNFDEISVGDLANILNDGFLNYATQSYVEGIPFFDNSIKEVEGNIKEIINKASKTDNITQAIGDLIKKEIENQIYNGDLRENTETTLKYKKGSHPLIDEGFLEDSIEIRIDK